MLFSIVQLLAIVASAGWLVSTTILLAQPYAPTPCMNHTVVGSVGPPGLPGVCLYNGTDGVRGPIGPRGPPGVCIDGLNSTVVGDEGPIGAPGYNVTGPIGPQGPKGPPAPTVVRGSVVVDIGNDVSTTIAYSGFTAVPNIVASCSYGFVSLEKKNITAATVHTQLTTFGSVTLDGPATRGTYTSMTMVGDSGQYAAVAYVDSTTNDLRYLRSLDTVGLVWGTPIIVDGATTAVGNGAVLRTINGNPAIFYCSTTATSFLYVRSYDSLGLVWGTPVVVDTNAPTTPYNAMRTVNGVPAVAYYILTTGDLKYAQAADANGTTWKTPITIDAFNNVGLYVSLEVVNGNPAVAYYDSTRFDLRYARALDPDGAVWSGNVTVDSPGTVGLYTSLRVIGGYPAIAYQDSVNGDLKYVRALDVNGTAWGTPLILDGPTVVGTYARMGVWFGLPFITYYDSTTTDLRLVRALDVNGTAWDVPVVVDTSPVSVGQYQFAMALVDGFLGISYYDATSGDLLFTRVPFNLTLDYIIVQSD